MSRKRPRRRLPNFLRERESQGLLFAAVARRDRARTPRKKLSAERDRLIVGAGLYLGLRVSEICTLRIEDLDLAAGVAMVLEGKGGKDRGVPIPAAFLAELVAWIGERTSGPVFPGPGGRRLSTRTVQLMIAALGREAGVPRKVKPHALRHTYATRLLETGANIREVQELLGHSSVSTTEVYTHVAPERLRAAVERLSGS